MDLNIHHQKGPRACMTCARAKSRCVPGAFGERCERCARLDKSCSSQTPAPPRKRKEPKPTKVAELERRLLELTSRIESAQGGGKQQQQQQQQQQQTHYPSPPQQSEQQQLEQEQHDSHMASPSSPARNQWSPPMGPNPPRLFQHLFPQDEPSAALPRDRMAVSTAASATTPSGTALSTSTAATSPATSQAPTCGLQAMLTPASSAASQSTPLDDGSWDADGIWPQQAGAEALLAEYQASLAPLWPFFVIRPGETAQSLRATRPFLWRAIMLDACQFDGPRQLVLGRRLLKDIADAALTRPPKQRSIDLLHGIQGLICWFHYNMNSFQVTNILFLARSICASLGFSESALSGPRARADGSPDLEAMRAYAGTYYLVTLVFTTNKKPDALMNTSYLETCCRALEDKMEYESDRLLVYFVRAQQLAQSIAFASAFRGMHLGGVDIPLSVSIKNLQSQVDAFRASLPESLKENPSLAIHTHTAEMMIYEISLQQQPDSRNVLSPTDRAAFLQALLSAAQNFMRFRFAAPLVVDDQPPRFSCLSAFELLYAFLIGLRLVTLTGVPGWDVREARARLVLDDVLDRFATDMELLAARRHAGMGGAGAVQLPHGYEDPFAHVALKLRTLRAALRYELESVYAVPAPCGNDGGDEDNAGEPAASIGGGGGGGGGSAAQAQATPSFSNLEGMTAESFQDMGGPFWQDLFSNNDWFGAGDDMMAIDVWQS